MALNKGLKKYIEDLREKRIKEQDKKIMGLRRLKYDEQKETNYLKTYNIYRVQ